MRLELEHFGQIDGDLETDLFQVYFHGKSDASGPGQDVFVGLDQLQATQLAAALMAWVCSKTEAALCRVEVDAVGDLAIPA
jgi:hypothetical protein